MFCQWSYKFESRTKIEPMGRRISFVVDVMNVTDKRNLGTLDMVEFAL